MTPFQSVRSIYWVIYWKLKMSGLQTQWHAEKEMWATPSWNFPSQLCAPSLMHHFIQMYVFPYMYLGLVLKKFSCTFINPWLFSLSVCNPPTSFTDPILSKNHCNVYLAQLFSARSADYVHGHSRLDTISHTFHWCYKWFRSFLNYTWGVLKKCSSKSFTGPDGIPSVWERKNKDIGKISRVPKFPICSN